MGRTFPVCRFLLLVGALTPVAAGCAARQAPPADELMVRAAIQRYHADGSDALATEESRNGVTRDGEYVAQVLAWASSTTDGSPGEFMSRAPVLTLGTLAWSGDEPAGSQPGTTRPAAAPASVPEGYWRQDVWHQMGREGLDMGRHDFWNGFKTSYWNVPNAMVLTAALGASLAVRGTGVDATVRGRTRGHRQLGDMDETIQLLGHPGAHFGAAGVLWLTSTLMQDVREHEVAKSLIQALAVNGASTLALKAAANTRTPDEEHFGWPSGHASSAFTAAAVLNEYYGPWVGVPSLALAGLVGYQRIDSRVHDLSDVVFGATLGYIIGSSIARDNKGQLPELLGMRVLPYVDPETGASGLALLKQW